jgi:hypothetical protein
LIQGIEDGWFAHDRSVLLNWTEQGRERYAAGEAGTFTTTTGQGAFAFWPGTAPKNGGRPLWERPVSLLALSRPLAGLHDAVAACQVLQACAQTKVRFVCVRGQSLANAQHRED